MKSWLSPAKLNLFLYITGRRTDNYHNLQTLFQFIDYCDTLTFTVRADNQINLLTAFNNVEHDKNLIVIAAKLLQSYQFKNGSSEPYGVDINIDKKIPMGGGLGGASSNAATVLVALNKLWKINLPLVELIKIGAKIGADVPIFIFGHAAFAEGVGDQLQKVEIPEFYYLVTYPIVEISTAKIFTDPQLTRNTPVRSINQLISFKNFKNDCENIVRKRYPLIDEIITTLSTFAPTRLTGTGSSVFTQCRDKAHALELQAAVKELPINQFITKTFIAKGVNRSPLYSS
ncbi:4-(cytidine 5'-diphospho)-2-C-methyl-D-erythritol kinase [Orbaceae bacterium ESL0721]|nr:4-(cytidine 5'-diphospho)-2-C-methyl-D-erythritol kinase [Orbaceae bacterium ESL0721]